VYKEVKKETTMTMGISTICVAALCLVASLSQGTNAFVVQPRSVSALSVKPAVSSLLNVASKSSQQQHHAGRRVMIETAQYAAATVVDPEDFDAESSSELSTPSDEVVVPEWKRTLKLTTLFFLWYVLNVGYNIGNKRVLNALPIPWTAATVELFFGFPYVAILWTTGLRKAPKLSLDNVKTLSSSAFFLAATHVLGVISFGAGAISFTHILKATEPVWAAVILAVGFKEILPVPVYLSLLPIIGGVGLASMKELSFSWVAFVTGTLSAVTSATKAILSKKVLDGKPLGENLTPANTFAVLTILGFLFILPASLLIEGPAKVSAAWAAALARGYTNAQLFQLLSVSGFLYYIYNEVAFLALSEVAPVTHAVANTVKRVVIILASVLVFRNPVSKLGAIGSALAIGGACVYSIAKSKCKPKEKTE
jgi:solute carrier family 35 protein E1